MALCELDRTQIGLCVDFEVSCFREPLSGIFLDLGVLLCLDILVVISLIR
jgi:hypothetical protein